MYLKERLAFFAIILTIPDSMHMWLTHNGQPFKDVWAHEPLHWVLYDIYTLSVFTMAIFFIVYWVVKITFHEQFDQWQYDRNLTCYLNQESVIVQLYFNAKQTGFDRSVFKGSQLEKFKLQTGSSSDGINDEIAGFFHQYNKAVIIEDLEEKFQVRIYFQNE